MADGFDEEKAGVVREGLAAAAAQDGATSGQVASVTDGELEFVDPGGGSQPFDTVEIDPGPEQIYGLLMQALAGFSDVFNAYIRVFDENGVQIFTMDNGGIDLKAPTGQGATHIRLDETDTLAVVDIGSRGLAIGKTDGGALINISEDFGIRMVSGTPPEVVGAEFCQIYYDSTPGAAKLVIRAKDANGTLVSGEVDLAP